MDINGKLMVLDLLWVLLEARRVNGGKKLHSFSVQTVADEKSGAIDCHEFYRELLYQVALTAQEWKKHERGLIYKVKVVSTNLQLC